jgi:hypothetical protein
LLPGGQPRDLDLRQSAIVDVALERRQVAEYASSSNEYLVIGVPAGIEILDMTQIYVGGSTKMKIVFSAQA